MWRVALRGIRAHWSRFLLTLVAVILGISFLTGTLMLRGVLGSTFNDILTTSRKAPIWVETKSEKDVNDPQREFISAKVADDLKVLPQVAYADPFYAEIGLILNTKDEPITRSGAPTIALGIFDHGNDPKLIEGTPPANADEVGIDKSMVNDFLKVGDHTKLILNGEVKTVKISATYSFGGSTLAAYVFMRAKDLKKVSSGMVQYIQVGPKDGYTVAQTIEAIRDKVSAVDVKTRQENIEEANERINTVLGFINIFLLAFVAIAIFVGAFIISNSFRMSVHSRQREFALLRAIGASTWNVFSVVLTQALVIAAIGSALGIAGGYGLVQLYMYAASRIGLKFTDNVPLTSGVIATAIILGFVVTTVGALLPAREAALTPPVQAMRSADVAARHMRWPRIVIAILFIAVGISGLAFATFQPNAKNAGIALGVGAIGLLLGVLAGAPAALPPIAWIIAVPWFLIRPQGQLALRNVSRHQRRSAATASALIIGVTLVTTGSVLAASAKSATADVIANELKADLTVFPVVGGATIPDSVIAKIKAVNGVKEVKGLGTSIPVELTKVKAKTTDTATTKTKSVRILGINKIDFQNSFNLKLKAGNVTDFGGNKCFLAKEFADKNKLNIGDVLNLSTPLKKVERTVAGTFESLLIDTAILCDESTSNIFIEGQKPIFQNAVITLDNPKDVDSVQQRIKDVLHGLYIYDVLNKEQLTSQAARQVNILLSVLYGLLSLSIVISVLGIINTLNMSISERVREIAMIRAVGMQRLGIAAMVMIESVIITIFGTIVGIGTGITLSFAIQRYAASSGLTVLTIPWLALITFVIVAGLVGVIASLLPALRAARRPVLEGIASD